MPRLPHLPLLLLAAVLAAGGTPLRGAPVQDPEPGAGGPEHRPPERIVVGSKNFTESVVLGELMAQMLEAHTGLEVVRRFNLGGTKVCWSALLEGEIDLYAEYTGTGWAIHLKEEDKVSDPLETYLWVQKRFRERWDVAWLLPFGLNNTYALAMDEDLAGRRDITRISDLLERGTDLAAGFSIEFMNREDGWPGLRAAYGLELAEVRALEHGLAYTAIRNGEIQLIDAYSTDGKLLAYDLRVLEDDRRFFPPYNAAPILREATLRALPEVRAVLERLAFRLPDAEAQRLNHRVEEEGATASAVARDWLLAEELIGPDAVTGTGGPASRASGFFALLWQRRSVTLDLILEHLALTGVAVLLAIALAVPLGIALAARERLRAGALAVAGVLQTIPSLALLAFMIPLLGLGVTAAVAALFLYALLPILRNTCVGIAGVDPDLIEAARGMGMREGQILRRVRLPLAMHTILAGIRTATVISIGVATLAAFIGAGGLGEPMVTGLYLDNTALILCGAVPAAILAILADGVLGLVERALAPRTSSAT